MLFYKYTNLLALLKTLANLNEAICFWACYCKFKIILINLNKMMKF